MTAIMSAIFVAVAGFFLFHAFNLARLGDWDRVWVLLADSLPFVAGSCFVLWDGLPAHDVSAVDTNHSGWRCVGWYNDFCYRQP